MLWTVRWDKCKQNICAKLTLIAWGAIGMNWSPLWYVIDSCPIIRAPPNGEGTVNKQFKPSSISCYILHQVVAMKRFHLLFVLSVVCSICCLFYLLFVLSAVYSICCLFYLLFVLSAVYSFCCLFYLLFVLSAVCSICFFFYLIAIKVLFALILLCCFNMILKKLECVCCGWKERRQDRQV